MCFVRFVEAVGFVVFWARAERFPDVTRHHEPRLGWFVWFNPVFVRVRVMVGAGVRLPLGERVHVARGVPAAGSPFKGTLQRTKLSNTPSVPTVSPPPPPLPLPTKYNNYFQTTSPPPL